jgi:secreted PhoX family phosphatase
LRTIEIRVDLGIEWDDSGCAAPVFHVGGVEAMEKVEIVETKGKGRGWEIKAEKRTLCWVVDKRDCRAHPLKRASLGRYVVEGHS